MQPWMNQSLFSRMLTQHCHHKMGARLCPSQLQDDHAMPAPLSYNDAIRNLLAEGIESLNSVASCFRQDLNLAAVIRQLHDALIRAHEGIEKALPARAQFRLIAPFISWFNRNAASSYTAVSNREPATLLFLLYIYSAFVALAAALPEINLAPFTTLRLRAILQIVSALSDRATFFCEACGGCHATTQLTKFPLHAANLYRAVCSIASEQQEQHGSHGKNSPQTDWIRSRH